jgi:hypothetical protein
VEGPDFDGHQVDFDQLMNRNRFYANRNEAAGMYGASDWGGHQDNMALEKSPMPHQPPDSRNGILRVAWFRKEMALKRAQR